MTSDNHNETRYLPLVLTIAFVMAIGASAAGEELAGDIDGSRFFSKNIAPLLKKHCLGCHSHAADEMGGGLTLDSRRGWQRGGDRGPAIVPGKPSTSLLIKAVRRQDSKLKMPPDEKLPEAAIAQLVEWIKRGAPDPREAKPESGSKENPRDWWSLRPLKSPPVPRSSVPRSSVQVRNPIDAFVHRQLRAQGLSPSPRASRRVLIRRLYFNLLGIPPEPDVVAAFEADSDPTAYEKLVDRLLNSPRYGERWARHWLDSIHFADSHGCEHDVFRPHAWRYRDYVIASFNRDTPWARFIREQLAADRFYPRDVRLTAALGFIAAGPLELSRASTAPVTFDYLDRDDIVTQTMAAFASTTANCARCHNHKFDPITQEDYYSLQAVFAGAAKGDVEYDADPITNEKRRRWNALLAAANSNDQVKLLAPQYAEDVARGEQRLASQVTVWQPLSPTKFESSEGATLKRLQDNSLLASGTRPEKDTYTISASPSLSRLTALRLDVLADVSLPMKGPGRQDNGNLHLSEFEAFVLAGDAPDLKPLKIIKATADWNQAGWTIRHAIDGNAATAWGVYPKVGETHYAVFELAEPVKLQVGSQVVVRLKQLHGGGHLIGRLKLYATDAAGATAVVLPDSVSSAIKLPRERRSKSQQAAIAAHVLKTKAEQGLAGLPAPVSVYAWSRRYSHGKKIGSTLR